MSNPNIGWRKAGIASAATALVLGASLAGAGAASAQADFEFDRIAGDDRYETAALAADEFDSSADEVILANGEPGHYADALSANYLANWNGGLYAPILLTRVNVTPQFTLDQLEDYANLNEGGNLDITIVGGTGVVSSAQADALRDLDYDVSRVSGADRYATNADVIAEVGGSEDIGVIATGENFPDALGAGPVAFQGHALGLSRTNNIDDVVVDALVDAGVESVIVLGGPTVVGPAVILELADAGITLERRIFGADRSETSTKLADYLLDNSNWWGPFFFEDDAVNVASGYTQGGGADALAGGPLTGADNRPMLITRDVNNPGDLTSWLEDNADTLIEGIIFGGTGAVSAAAEATMEAAAQGGSAPTIDSATLEFDAVAEGGVDEGDAWELVFSEDMNTSTVGDVFELTDGGDTIRVECGLADAVDDVTGATCSFGDPDTLTITLTEDAEDRNVGGNDVVTYPLTITGTTNVENPDGFEVNVGGSADVTIG